MHCCIERYYEWLVTGEVGNEVPRLWYEGWGQELKFVATQGLEVETLLWRLCYLFGLIIVLFIVGKLS